MHETQFEKTQGQLDNSAVERTEHGLCSGGAVLPRVFLMPNLVFAFSLLWFGIIGFSLLWHSQFSLRQSRCQTTCLDLGLWEEKATKPHHIYILVILIPRNITLFL